MNNFSLAMRVVSAFLMAYFFLIFAQVMLSWFPNNSSSVSRIKDLLNRITEPYLRHFRNIRWLRTGVFDFSAMLGLSVLSLALYITQRLSSGHIPGFVELLVLVIQMIWSLFSFILLLLILFLALRLVCIYMIRGSRPYWIERLDAFLFPMVSRVLGFITKKTISYPAALGINLALFLLIRIMGAWVLTKALVFLLL